MRDKTLTESREDFGLRMVRSYHRTLLGYANRDVEMRKSLQDSDCMPFLWQYGVAQMITKGKETMKELAQTIATLRKDYNCVTY